jgi:hypothetical protein
MVEFPGGVIDLSFVQQHGDQGGTGIGRDAAGRIRVRREQAQHPARGAAITRFRVEPGSLHAVARSPRGRW